jgi:ribosomal protein L12E/L44/L45/RPP1/RPP2
LTCELIFPHIGIHVTNFGPCSFAWKSATSVDSNRSNDDDDDDDEEEEEEEEEEDDDDDVCVCERVR